MRSKNLSLTKMELIKLVLNKEWPEQVVDTFLEEAI